MFLQLFYNWLEIAEEGVRLETIPRGEPRKELLHKKINFAFCLKVDEIEQPVIQFLVKNPDNVDFKFSECNCKVGQREQLRSFTPLAISMMNIENDHKKKEIQEYVDHYLGKLCML